MDNITITTTGGHVVTMRPFITGAQRSFISYAFLDAAHLKGLDSDGKPNPILPSEQVLFATRRSLETVVLSIDGAIENVADMILSLPSEETEQVKKQMNLIIEGKKNEPNTPTT